MNIVLFGLSLVSFSQGFKMRLLGNGFHTLKNIWFPSPTDVGSHNLPHFGVQHPRRHSFPSATNVGSHNPPPFRVQRPRWQSFPSPTNVGSHNSPALRTRVKGSHWHSFPYSINVGSHNPPPSGPCVLAGTPPGVHPPSRLSVLVGTPPCVWL